MQHLQKVVSAISVLLLVACQFGVGQTVSRKAMHHQLLPKAGSAVGDPLSAGTYTVGSGGYFPTLDSAFRRLSGAGILGAVTLSLTDTLYLAPAADKGAFTLVGPIAGTGASSRITIRPADNVAATIRGHGEGTLIFRNTGYLTLDGISLQDDTRLRVHALNDTAGDSWNDAIECIGNCDFVVIQNLKVSTDDIEKGAAIDLSGDAFGAPDSCIVAGIAVTSGAIGIYVAAGVGMNAGPRPQGNLLRNNHIGSATDSLCAWGIQNERADGTVVENNHIENLRLSYWGDYRDYQFAIDVYFSNDVVIRNNVVHNLCLLGPGIAEQLIAGIIASGSLPSERGSGVHIYNNSVYDITNRHINAPSVELAGIRAWQQTNLRIDFNSVYLWEAGDVAPIGGSAAAWWNSSVENPIVRNNIFVNTRNDSPYVSCALRAQSAPWVSNHNDLYAGTSAGAYIACRGAEVYTSLADWQATGNDAQSVSVMPSFRSERDLHIDTLASRSRWVPLSNNGIAITGCDYDQDNDNRIAANMPDIGADEFWIHPDPPTAVANDGVTSPTTFSLEQNYPNPFNPTTTIRYGLPSRAQVTLYVFNTLGQQVAQLVNGEVEAGYHEVRFDGSDLPSGVYLYRMQAGSYVETEKLLVVR